MCARDTHHLVPIPSQGSDRSCICVLGVYKPGNRYVLYMCARGIQARESIGLVYCARGIQAREAICLVYVC